MNLNDTYANILCEYRHILKTCHIKIQYWISTGTDLLQASSQTRSGFVTQTCCSSLSWISIHKDYISWALGDASLSGSWKVYILSVVVQHLTKDQMGRDSIHLTAIPSQFSLCQPPWWFGITVSPGLVCVGSSYQWSWRVVSVSWTNDLGRSCSLITEWQRYLQHRSLSIIKADKGETYNRLGYDETFRHCSTSSYLWESQTLVKCDKCSEWLTSSLMIAIMKC